MLEKEYKSILVIKMSSLGDVIHALPSLYELRNLYPNAKIYWLVEPQFAAILPEKPYIDEKIIFYKNDLKNKSFFEKISYLKALRKKLHSYNFDLVIDLQGLMKSTLIALLSGCNNRIGYAEMREGSFLFTKAIIGSHVKDHVVERYLDVLRYLGADIREPKFPLPDFEHEEQTMKDLLAKYGVTGTYAVFFPGTRWPTKEWPADNFAALAKKLADIGVFTVLAGAPAEEEKGKEITLLTKSDFVVDIIGKTSIVEIAGLIKNAALCLGGDTGPMHVAAAVGVPTISLFGPVSPDRTAAYGKKSVVIKTTASCAPCFKRICPKEFICMDLISVDSVYNVCERFLNERDNER